jgi:hypothetical protein
MSPMRSGAAKGAPVKQAEAVVVAATEAGVALVVEEATVVKAAAVAEVVGAVEEVM